MRVPTRCPAGQAFKLGALSMFPADSCCNGENANSFNGAPMLEAAFLHDGYVPYIAGLRPGVTNPTPPGFLPVGVVWYNRDVNSTIPDEGEAGRLAALRRTGLLDTLPEPEFDRITRLAANVIGVPIALMSLVDDHRQWFKSRVGLDASETLREHAFCAHAIEYDELMIVPERTLAMVLGVFAGWCVGCRRSRARRPCARSSSSCPASWPSPNDSA